MVDKESSDVLFEWLKLFEIFIYKWEGDWCEFVDKNKLIKLMILKFNLFYG